MKQIVSHWLSLERFKVLLRFTEKRGNRKNVKKYGLNLTKLFIYLQRETWPFHQPQKLFPYSTLVESVFQSTHHPTIHHTLPCQSLQLDSRRPAPWQHTQDEESSWTGYQRHKIVSLTAAASPQNVSENYQSWFQLHTQKGDEESEWNHWSNGYRCLQKAEDLENLYSCPRRQRLYQRPLGLHHQITEVKIIN